MFEGVVVCGGVGVIDVGSGRGAEEVRVIDVGSGRGAEEVMGQFSPDMTSCKL